MAAARNIAEYSGRRIDGDLHSVDARLPENKKNESRSNARVHIIVPPCSKNGICISIRKFRKSVYTDTVLRVAFGLNAPPPEMVGFTVTVVEKNFERSDNLYEA